jgi:uncharacterized protein YndB with AHSA1/START domain
MSVDRRDVFRASADEVWAHLARPERFPVWWRWLRDFEVVGDGLSAGTVFHGLVVPPVPYRLRVEVRLTEVVAGERIRAALGGDLSGPAEVTLRSHPRGCEVAVAWRLEMRSLLLRRAAWFARPLLVVGHDQVVAATVRRFRSIVEPP